MLENKTCRRHLIGVRNESETIWADNTINNKDREGVLKQDRTEQVTAQSINLEISR